MKAELEIKNPEEPYAYQTPGVQDTERKALVTQPDNTTLPPVDSIPKPKGTAGKPSNGGYSLAKELGWNYSEYLTVQVSKFKKDGIFVFHIM